MVFTLIPKIKIGKEDAFISFRPRYHNGNLSARGWYYVYNKANDTCEFTENQKKSAAISFWSFSLGFEGFAVQTGKYWFTLFLNYTRMDTREAFRQMEFSDDYVQVFNGHSNTIGSGVRFYLNPFPPAND